jgi:hypothetical protein
MAYTTINKSTDYFNTVLYTGNGTAIGSGGKTVTGVGFQPDFVWGKARSGTDAVDNHVLTDAVRGATKYLKSNATSSETTDTESLTSFTNDGFTLGSNGQLNRNGNNCVAWNWKANGQGSSNTDGSINTTYTSVNTTAGFSISSYTGTGSNATVGHGLGATPKMFIIKSRSIADNWLVYHENIGNTKRLRLNSTNAETTDANVFNNTSPTSSVLNLGHSSEVNASGATYVAYCFAEKTGYSKFGKYSANQNSDGPFTYLGFKPAFLMIKRLGTDPWMMLDNKRDGYNVTEKFLAGNANDSEATEGSSVGIDFLSNGFKCRGTSGKYNSTNSGVEYIYMAFAEAPLVGSNNVPCTAR